LVSLKEKTDDDTDAASVVNSNRGGKVRKMRTDSIANIIRLTLLNGYGYCSGSEKKERKKNERRKAAISAH